VQAGGCTTKVIGGNHVGKDTELKGSSRVVIGFCAGTPYRSPIEAVESGAKSLREWCEFLAEQRERRGGNVEIKLSAARQGRSAEQFGHEQTAKQQRLMLECAALYEAECNRGPMAREISQHIGINEPRVRQVCMGMVDQGLMTRVQGHDIGERSNATFFLLTDAGRKAVK
jgi:hypothetical protein